MYLSPIWRILDGMDSGERWTLGHRPALDGLRGVAVLLVIAYHASHDLPAGGVVGVTAFFVLSGFLITSLLLEERERTGTVSLRGFYVRRARRLFPALAMMLALGAPLALVSGTVSVAGIVAVAGYSANWWMLTGHDLGMLVHTWTLATEEQFYLLWPVALLAIARARKPLLIVGVLALIPLVFTHQLGIAISSDALLAGCAMALWFHTPRTLRAAPAGAVPVCLALLVVTSFAPWAPIWTVALATLGALGVVYAIAVGSPTPLLQTPLARALGRRSYGLYLWHLPVLTFGLWIGVAAGLGYWQSLAVTAPVLLGIVELSWHFVEQPFLRKRSVHRSAQGGTRGTRLLVEAASRHATEGSIGPRGAGSRLARTT
jgi:peptidoglycan/LPS O-acetylase OafA/YrhL